MEIKIYKSCGRQFLSETKYSYCRICSKKWHEEQAKLQEQAENLKWKELKKQEQKVFESEVQAYKPILMENIIPSAQTLYIIGSNNDITDGHDGSICGKMLLHTARKSLLKILNYA